MKPRLRADWGDISLLRDKFVRSENLRRCCFVPIRNFLMDREAAEAYLGGGGGIGPWPLWQNFF